ncbi:phage baseplate assembly protein V [Spongiibacter tropicus]|uniref:phage baseplate assembly protein V n=1 Tax=Spongiibacter tropicus TaxID=454602 RepID=UPI0035BE5EB5
MTELELISDLQRRIANLLTLGIVHSVDGIVCRVAIGGDANNLTPPIKWLANRAADEKSWSQLDVGEQVMLLCPSGDPGNAVALPGLYSAAKPAPSADPDETVSVLPDGAVFSYHHGNQHLSVTLPEGATTELITDGGLHIVGDTEIDGNVTINGTTHSTGAITTDDDIAAAGSIHADGDVSDGTRSMGADRDIYNSHDHPNGVPNTGIPSQQQ